MLRRLRVLAAFFMLPLCLVFATPQHAAAATNEVVKINLPGPIPGTDANCQVSLAMTPTTGGATLLVNSASDCYAGPDISPGYCQEFEGGCTDWTLTVKGPGCPATGVLLNGNYDGPRNSVVSMHTIIGGGALPVGTCDPLEVCLTAVTDSPLPGKGAVTISGCAPSTLDGIQPVSEPQCGNGGKATAPQVSKPIVKSTTNAFYFMLERKHVGKFTMPVNSSGYNTVVQYSISRSVPAGTGLESRAIVLADGTTAYVMYNPSASSGGLTSNLDWTGLLRNAFYSPSGTGTPEADQARLIGAGYFVTTGMTPQQVTPGLYVAGVGSSGISGNPERLGLTDSNVCAFYWGEKIARLTGAGSGPNGEDIRDEPIDSTIAEPGAPTSGEPVEPPPVPAPDPEDVPDDEVGLLGWLAELLRMLIRAVGQIPGLIIDGITNLFDAVFIPSDGFLDNRVDRLSSSWEDTAPAKIVDAVSQVSAPAGSSDCSGVELRLTLPGDVQVDEQIGAACSGGMATASTIVNMALSCTFVLGGMFACVRAVGSGLGWNPGVGRVES